MKRDIIFDMLLHASSDLGLQIYGKTVAVIISFSRLALFITVPALAIYSSEFINIDIPTGSVDRVQRLLAPR